jgi:rare lipoprotein A
MAHDMVRRGISVALAAAALFLGSCASRPDLVWTEDGRQFGKASWYDDHGDRTANGERFNMNAYTAAHPSLALNSLVEVTNLRNGKTVTVRINDRLPTYHERVIDLSVAAFRKLDSLERGLMDVELRVIRYGNNRYVKTEATAPDGKLYLASASPRKEPVAAAPAPPVAKEPPKPATEAKAAPAAAKPAAPAKSAAASKPSASAKAKAVTKPAAQVKAPAATAAKASAKSTKPAAKPASSTPKEAPKAAPKPTNVTWESEEAAPDEWPVERSEFEQAELETTRSEARL